MSDDSPDTRYILRSRCDRLRRGAARWCGSCRLHPHTRHLCHGAAGSLAVLLQDRAAGPVPAPSPSPAEPPPGLPQGAGAGCGEAVPALVRSMGDGVGALGLDAPRARGTPLSPPRWGRAPSAQPQLCFNF